jgi:hypothetical protein
MAVRHVPDIQEWGPDVWVDGAMEQARPGAGASWAMTQGPQFFWPQEQPFLHGYSSFKVEEACGHSLYSLAGPPFCVLHWAPKTYIRPCMEVCRVSCLWHVQCVLQAGEQARSGTHQQGHRWREEWRGSMVVAIVTVTPRVTKSLIKSLKI